MGQMRLDSGLPAAGKKKRLPKGTREGRKRKPRWLVDPYTTLQHRPRNRHEATATTRNIFQHHSCCHNRDIPKYPCNESGRGAEK